MKKILLMLPLFFVFGCSTPKECQVLCDRLEEWNKACNVVGESLSACYYRFSTVGLANEREARQNTKMCRHFLAQWILSTQKETLDCNVPSPIGLVVEKE